MLRQEPETFSRLTCQIEVKHVEAILSFTGFAFRDASGFKIFIILYCGDQWVW